MLGEGPVPVFFLVIFFNLTNKMSALYMWAAFGFICWFNAGILKPIYAEPRPFWVSSEIMP